MAIPVDLTNLRSMTDGDKDMEKSLFEEFYSSFEAGMNTLQTNTGGSTVEAWRKEAHALKGIALNLGANRLGELCKRGQDDHLASETSKQELLKQINDEYNQVKSFLKALS